MGEANGMPVVVRGFRRLDGSSGTITVDLCAVPLQSRSGGARQARRRSPGMAFAHAERMMRLSELLQECARLEDRIGDLYERFGAAFGEDAELGSFWSEMAQAERAHASVLQEAADNPRADEQSADASALGVIRGYVGALTGWRTPATLDEALRTALDIEELELDQVHAALLGVLGEPFPKPGSHENDEHRALLLDVIARRGTARALLARAEAQRRRGRSRDEPSIASLLKAIERQICNPFRR
jgi:hypothetical protein